MFFEQFYLDCLSQASYFIGDETTGRAVVVDPRRDVELYVETARKHSMTIELVLETHFHADFLSGHLELAELTGADIGYGADAHTDFDSRKFADGERVELGEVTLEVRHTPGHTPESISVVVFETADAAAEATPFGVLTGDTLFIGDVGRPDLLSSVGVTADDLAGRLYDSLHEKLLTLPDSTRVYPAHGAGSSCGKNLSTDTWSTIGVQRQTNYALAPMTKEAFVEVVTAGQTCPPAYFAYDAALNRKIRPLLDESGVPPTFDLRAAVDAQHSGAVVLDTRDPETFAAGHIRHAINVGLAGRYAEFAGGVIEPNRPIILVTNPGEEREAKNRLARIGFDQVIGAVENFSNYLGADHSDHSDHSDQIEQSKRTEVEQLRHMMASTPNLQLVDVRQPGETDGGSIAGATLMPLTRLNEQLATLDPARPTVVYCAGGFRSSIAASTMAAAGFSEISDLIGGFGMWESSN